MANQSEQARQISLGDNFGAAVIALNGLHLEVGADGKSVRVICGDCMKISHAANENRTSVAISLAQRALEVGDRLRDGTVVLSVDLEKNEALFVPEGIFGGKAKFDHQDRVVKDVNSSALHGHKDWRRITNVEGAALSEVWDKVAPPALGDARPWFWLVSSSLNSGQVSKGGISSRFLDNRNHSWLVPVIRSGPARLS